MGNYCSKLCLKKPKCEPLITQKDSNSLTSNPDQDKIKHDLTKQNNSNLRSSMLNNTFYDYSFIKKEISKQDFEIVKLLGRGSFGKVLLVKHKLDNKLYAMKILKKETIKRTNQVAHTKTERVILERMDHPFIVRLQFAFQTSEKLYLITDFMQGGELFYHLHKEIKFTETKAKLYSAEIVLAIEYLHKNNIIYRDLKPENILLDEDGHIKLTDFGLSKLVLNNETSKAYTICGTPEYLAPEILSGNGYDKSVDWWSLGALVYEMLNGVPPFKFRKEKKLDINNYKKPLDIPKSFSFEARSFISDLLQVDPKMRLGCGPQDAEIIKSHEFFNGIDWRFIYQKRNTAPFKPVLHTKDDLSYFDRIFTNENPKESPEKLDERLVENEYEKFTYVKEEGYLK